MEPYFAATAATQLVFEGRLFQRLDLTYECSGKARETIEGTSRLCKQQESGWNGQACISADGSYVFMDQWVAGCDRRS